MRTYLLPVAILALSTTAAAQLSPTSKVKTCKAPLFSTFDPSGARLYITCFASDDVAVYDTASGNAETRFYGGFEPQGIAVTPDGAKIFVTNRRGLVKVIDSRSFKILDDVKLGGVPSNITIPGSGLRAFVTNYGRGKIGQVDIIDTSSHRVEGTIEVGVRPLVAAVAPLGDQLFVACAGSNDLYVLNPTTKKVEKRIPVGLGPNGLAFTTDGTTLLVSNSGTDDLSVIDVLDLQEVRRVPVGKSPFSMAVDDRGRVFIVESGARVLSVYSPELTKIASFPAGKKPIDVQISPDGGMAAVTDEKDNRLLLFRID